MKPSVVFKGLAELSSSIFLTSGTLSPMHSFSCELGINFGTCFEASHVIQKWQVCARAIFKGANNELLKATLANASKHSFQDALGKVLEEICQRVPNGSLVFFPSYRLMMELCQLWKLTSQWERLRLNRKLLTGEIILWSYCFETVTQQWLHSNSLVLLL
ncbi:Regulator of telomere elongation helicase 1 [Cardamine amara subsp. amara]|uniref:Regulator of telomere elongation helicase 1 n=1 Tax=Cardamine amara subsp. amara TaxID=228776 RepID=A0ABD0ZV48_CARAN